MWACLGVLRLVWVVCVGWFCCCRRAVEARACVQRTAALFLCPRCRIPQEHVAGAGLQDVALQQQRAQLEAARMASLTASGGLAPAEVQQQQKQDAPRGEHDVVISTY